MAESYYTAPNGEIIRSGHSQTVAKTPEVTFSSTVAGQHVCPKCGLACTSAGSLQSHLLNNHRGLSSMVELPDGTEVPADLLSQELAKSDKVTAELRAENEALRSTLDKLENRLKALEGKKTKTTKKAK